jgi:hypothetical protein
MGDGNFIAGAPQRPLSQASLSDIVFHDQDAERLLGCHRVHTPLGVLGVIY